MLPRPRHGHLVEPQPIVPDGCFELIVHLGEPFVEQGVYAAAPSAADTVESAGRLDRLFASLDS